MTKKPFYIDAAYDKDKISYWFRDFDGTLYRDEVDKEDYIYGYVIANDGKDHPLKSIFGDPVKRVQFESMWDMEQYASDREDVVFEMDVQPMTRFLIDMFHDADVTSPINIGFYDIEVDYDLEEGKGFPLPQNPYGQVNAFQLFDVAKEKYVLIFLDSMPPITLTDDEYPVEIHWCSTEYDLLNKIAEVIDDIDLLGGWYTDGFDLPYIMERAILLFGEDYAKTMFCRDGFKAKKREFVDDFGNDVWNWTLVGRQHVDMMELFKKFEPGEKENGFGLSAICEEYINERKVEYAGDLGELYRQNPQKWAEYALHDVRLLRKLNKALGIMDQAITMSRDCSVFVRDVTGSVKPIETKFMKFCRNEKVVLPNKKNHVRQSFPGAIVYDTIPGLHRNGFTIDLSGLYPSCLILLGLSTETLLFQSDGGYEDFIKIRTMTDDMVTLRTRDGKEKFELKAHEVWTMIKEEGYTLSANGTIFTGELGLLAKFTKSVFDDRRRFQALKAEHFEKGDMVTANMYDLFQRVTKIFANSIYGTLGNIAFRLFDIRLAMSITLTGQIVSKEQAVRVNELVMELAS